MGQTAMRTVDFIACRLISVPKTDRYCPAGTAYERDTVPRDCSSYASKQSQVTVGHAASILSCNMSTSIGPSHRLNMHYDWHMVRHHG
jgi:hypothetical protein